MKPYWPIANFSFMIFPPLRFDCLPFPVYPVVRAGESVAGLRQYI
jgi:hypothetical protein